MKTFFLWDIALNLAFHISFASNISFHVLPLFLVARFSILSSSQACLLSLFSCKVYCLLSATKNEERFFYSKFHIISLLDFSLSYSGNKICIIHSFDIILPLNLVLISVFHKCILNLFVNYTFGILIFFGCH